MWLISVCYNLFYDISSSATVPNQPIPASLQLCKTTFISSDLQNVFVNCSLILLIFYSIPILIWNMHTHSYILQSPISVQWHQSVFQRMQLTITHMNLRHRRVRLNIQNKSWHLHIFTVSIIKLCSDHTAQRQMNAV